MAWPKTSLITDDTQQRLRSGPLDLTEESKWGNKVGMEGEKLYIHMRKDRRRLSGRNSQEKHQDLAGTSVGFHPSCVDPIMMKKLLAL
ncbi:unnamed protein product [Brassica oleracea]